MNFGGVARGGITRGKVCYQQQGYCQSSFKTARLLYLMGPILPRVHDSDIKTRLILAGPGLILNWPFWLANKIILIS